MDCGENCGNKRAIRLVTVIYPYHIISHPCLIAIVRIKAQLMKFDWKLAVSDNDSMDYISAAHQRNGDNVNSIFAYLPNIGAWQLAKGTAALRTGFKRLSALWLGEKKR